MKVLVMKARRLVSKMAHRTVNYRGGDVQWAHSQAALHGS